MTSTILFFSILGLLFFPNYFLSKRLKQQADYIQNYTFKPWLKTKLRSKHPHLDEEQIAQVFEGLRDYFHICNNRKRQMVSMPSQVVDDAWHEFILFSREYQIFCQKAFGRFLHHTPAEAMKSPTDAQDGIKRAWRLACHREKIDPKKPDKLPRLFAMDAMLLIAGGFVYSLDCKALSSNPGEFCASTIGCGGGCGGSGCGSSGCGSSGCGSGCGGGCGGGG